MKAIAGKEIRVIEPTSDFRAMVEKELTVSNPEYARKQKMGKWVGGTPVQLNSIGQRERI